MQLSFLSPAVLYVLMICSVHGQGNNDCGVDGWFIPDPPADAKLLQVNAIIRHGDRTPWTGASCWPNDSAVWNCLLTSAQVPIFSDAQEFPRLYRKVFLSGGEPLNGNCSVGQLTTEGYVQHITNGDFLSRRYVHTGFLEPSLTSDVYIRSDDSPRTLQSAEALIIGMYPDSSSRSGIEVAKLHTLDREYDYITANPTLCPKFGEYQLEFKKSSVWNDHQNITKYVLNEISNAINFTVGENDLDHFVDCLRTHHCHKLSWPPGMTEKLYNMSWDEFSWQIFSSFAYPSVQENAQVGIGFLLKEIWQNMNKSVENRQVQKFLLYSGHDTTLVPLLVALQVDTMKWPAYASMMLIELYEKAGTFYVRVIYNGEVLPMSFCNSETLCDFKTFSEYMKTVTPSNPALQCQV